MSLNSGAGLRMLCQAVTGEWRSISVPAEHSKFRPKIATQLLYGRAILEQSIENLTIEKLQCSFNKGTIAVPAFCERIRIGLSERREPLPVGRVAQRNGMLGAVELRR